MRRVDRYCRSINADYVQFPASDSLEAAIHAIECGLRADAPNAGGNVEGERAGFEWRCLRDWCDRTGREIAPEVVPNRVGGREHDVEFVESAQRWRKFTKWNSAGYVVEVVDNAPLFLPATPLQYLLRLRLQNQIFGDDFTLLGIQRQGHDLRMVIEQSHVVGSGPLWEDLDRLLLDQHGFTRLNIPPMGYYKSYSYLRGNVGVFDVHPANCVLIESGELVPIDFISVEFEASAADALRRYPN